MTLLACRVPYGCLPHVPLNSAFMSKFHVKLSARAKNLKDGEAMFDAMYADREKLEAIFRFFDTDSNGSISREEFFRVSILFVELRAIALR